MRKPKWYDWFGLGLKKSTVYLTFHIGCCPVLLPGLDRADLFVVAVHVVVEEANDGGLS